MIAGHMAEAEALDKKRRESSRVDHVDSQSTGSIKGTWLN